MKKCVVLIDGNNLLFRSYYATAYSGQMMQNSKGLPTNALLGFVKMLNKIRKEEKPEYIVVAFDKGKTFRHEQYPYYKAGRLETPVELLMQFEWAKKLLIEMGIKYVEAIGYEADDIIGTFANMVTNSNEYKATIISSDKDLLQLINDQVEVKLLKTKGYNRINKQSFIKEYGLEPIHIIDLKGLQGDTSDNIPGVKGIGEKTALKLLQEYKSIEELYLNLDQLKGKLKENLIKDWEMALLSKQLATINKEVPLNLTLEDIKYKGVRQAGLIKLYEELEFYSLLKKLKQELPQSALNVKIIKEGETLNFTKPISVYLEIQGSNYHLSEIHGLGIYDGNQAYYAPLTVLRTNPSFLKNNIKWTYDAKKVIVALRHQGLEVANIEFDTMLASYLLNYNIKTDIAYLANQLNYDLPFDEVINKTKELDELTIANICGEKAKFIYETKVKFEKEMATEDCAYLFNEIEMPLVKVLSEMEFTGIKVDETVLKEMGAEVQIKMELLTKDIHNYAGVKFNINSPKQLGEVLFEELKLPYKGKLKKNYVTSREVLIKIKDCHPIINKILEYRMLAKIYNSYIEGLINFIMPDGRIRTIFNQTLTRTGRLSAMEPNLQNIPIRYEYGRLVRKAFLPDPGCQLVSSDYSQIELRVFAHMSKADNLVDAFKQDLDIHTKTAMDVFKVEAVEVNSEMRRQAKAVNFGILYGISSFGLAEDLNIEIREAKEFINKYLATFPGIKQYMDSTIATAYQNGYVQTLMQRKRVITELNNKNYMIRQQGERMALNTPVQGSSADIIKKAMIELFAKFKELGLQSKMIIQVHDELIFNVVKSEKEIVIKTIKEVMTNCYQLIVPLKVEIKVGANWYQA